MKLNDNQQEAVFHEDGPCLIAACPGSGKTRTITERVKRLVRCKKAHGRDILNITFTNKAAKEMKRRLLDDTSTVNLSDVSCSTFHSLSISVLRKFSKLLGLDSNVTILDTDSVISIMSSFESNKDYDQKELRYLHSSYSGFREKCYLTSDVYDHFDQKDSELLSSLEDYFKSSNSIDFSGMLYRFWELLRDHEEVREFMNSRFSYVQVDEFQDTNLIQLEIIKRICEHKNIVAVGDQDQAIYGWRGARPENMKDFLSIFDPVKIITLNINYRSTPEILRVANNLMSNATGRINNAIEAFSDSGHDVRYSFCESRDKESYTVASQIRHYTSIGYKPKDIAILYRTTI